MAYIEPRKNKQGEIIAYRIRVNKGYDKNGKKLKPYELNFKPDPDKTERQNMKALNETAVEFEKKCKQGYVADSRQSFAEQAIHSPKYPILDRDRLIRGHDLDRILRAVCQTAR